MESNEPSLSQIDDYNGTASKAKNNLVGGVIALLIAIGAMFAVFKLVLS